MFACSVILSSWLPCLALPFLPPSTPTPLLPASFAPISFAIKAKENDMLPLEKNRVRLDDDSDEERAAEEELEGGAAGAAGATGSAVAGGVAVAAQVVREAPAAPPPEEKKPTLTLEELEAKQGRHQSHLLTSMHIRALSDTIQELQVKAVSCRPQCNFVFILLCKRVPLEGPLIGRVCGKRMKRLAI